MRVWHVITDDNYLSFILQNKKKIDIKILKMSKCRGDIGT